MWSLWLSLTLMPIFFCSHDKQTGRVVDCWKVCHKLYATYVNLSPVQSLYIPQVWGWLTITLDNYSSITSAYGEYCKTFSGRFGRLLNCIREREITFGDWFCTNYPPLIFLLGRELTLPRVIKKYIWWIF